METNPIEVFSEWLALEITLTKVNIPTACCLSTIGIDNYPNARFVSLKTVTENSFIVTGAINSMKGQEINQSNKIALTFWWTETERQVRIQGNASPISNELADKYFAERNLDSQIVSIVSNQGHALYDMDALNKKYEELKATSKNQDLSRPKNWGGYSIEPIRIEFFTFKPSRFHHRKLYQLKGGKWEYSELQP